MPPTAPALSRLAIEELHIGLDSSYESPYEPSQAAASAALATMFTHTPMCSSLRHLDLRCWQFEELPPCLRNLRLEHLNMSTNFECDCLPTAPLWPGCWPS